MTPAEIDRVFGRGRLRMVTGDHVEVFREAVAAGRAPPLHQALPGHRRRRLPRVDRARVAHPRAPRRPRHHAGARRRPVRPRRRRSARRWSRPTTPASPSTTGRRCCRSSATARRCRNVFEDCAHWWALARAQPDRARRDPRAARSSTSTSRPTTSAFRSARPTSIRTPATARLQPRFDELALIDFAFSLVSGERARQRAADRRADRLRVPVAAPAAGARGRAGAATSARRASSTGAATSSAWRRCSGATCPSRGRRRARLDASRATRKARALVRRLIAAHDAELPPSRPHGELIALATEPLRAADLQRSLRARLDPGGRCRHGAARGADADHAHRTDARGRPVRGRDADGGDGRAKHPCPHGGPHRRRSRRRRSRPRRPRPCSRRRPSNGRRPANARRRRSTWPGSPRAARRFPRWPRPSRRPTLLCRARGDSRGRRRARGGGDRRAAAGPGRAGLSLRRRAAWGSALVATAALGTALWLRPGSGATPPGGTAAVAHVAAVSPPPRAPSAEAPLPRVAPEPASAIEAVPSRRAPRRPRSRRSRHLLRPLKPTLPAATPTSAVADAAPAPSRASCRRREAAASAMRPRATGDADAVPRLAPAARVARTGPRAGQGAARCGVGPRVERRPRAAPRPKRRRGSCCRRTTRSSPPRRSEPRPSCTDVSSTRATSRRAGRPGPGGETVAWAVAGRSPASSPGPAADGAAAGRVPGGTTPRPKARPRRPRRRRPADAPPRRSRRPRSIFVSAPTT